MRLRKAPRIRLDSAKAVPQVFSSAAQASVAAFILYTLSISMSIVESTVQENRVGSYFQVINFHVLLTVFYMSLFKLHVLRVE
jgi:hypothetical protein